MSRRAPAYERASARLSSAAMVSRRPFGRAPWVLFAALPACFSYSPSLRTTDYGAPGRLAQGDLEVGGGMTAISKVPAGGGAFVGYGLRDWVSVEGGLDGTLGERLMGFGGGRFTYAPKRAMRRHVALDGELGLGFGAGGRCYTNENEASTCAPGPWSGRTAFGGYLGAGASYHLSFFAVYARVRGQAGLADSLPGTLWGSAHGGVQLRIARLVDLFSSVGYSGLTTREGHGAGFLTWSVGTSIHFGVPIRRRRARPE